MSNDQILSALDWRYAVKKFDASKNISAADWTTLEASLLKAPSSFGLQPYQFLVVETPELRAKLREVSWNQSQIIDASKLVVLLSRRKIDDGFIKNYVRNMATTRGLPVQALDGFAGMLDTFAKGLSETDALAWARKQTYIALGFLLQTASLLRVDSTPIEGFDPKAYDKILNLEGTDWTTSVVAVLGYRHAEDEAQTFKKVRREKADIIQYR